MKLIEIDLSIDDPFNEPERPTAWTDEDRVNNIRSYLDHIRRTIHNHTKNVDSSHQRAWLKSMGVPSSSIVSFRTSSSDENQKVYYNVQQIPNLKRLENLYRRLITVDRKYEEAVAEYTAATEIAKAAGRQLSSVKKKSKNEAPNTTTIPLKINAGGSTFGNPYHKAAQGETPFAGPVSSFPFTSTQITILNTLDAALKRNGAATMSVCYATNNKPPVECAVVSADGKVAWRKFGLSNVIMFNGYKINSSAFLSLAPAAQDAIVQAM